MCRRNCDLPQLVKEVSSKLTHWNGADLVSQRRAFALDNTYDRQIDRINELILEHVPNCKVRF